MTPTEFVLWLNGALGVMGDTPTPEQMAKVRDKLGEAIGKITADRLLERADEQVKRDKERAEKEAELAKMKAMMSQQLAQRLDEDTFRILAAQTNLHAAKVDLYAARIDEYSQTLSVGSGTLAELPPGTTIAAAPTPTKSGGILGSLLRPAAKARA